MRWIGQLAVAVNRNGKEKQRHVPGVGTSSPGARRRHRANRRGR